MCSVGLYQVTHICMYIWQCNECQFWQNEVLSSRKGKTIHIKQDRVSFVCQEKLNFSFKEFIKRPQDIFTTGQDIMSTDRIRVLKNWNITIQKIYFRLYDILVNLQWSHSYKFRLNVDLTTVFTKYRQLLMHSADTIHFSMTSLNVEKCWTLLEKYCAPV